MRIDRETYGLYIIDYLEGNLDESTIAELMSFLDSNPDLKEELEMLGSTSDEEVALESFEFTGRDLLKKPLYEEISQDLDHELIAKLEGDLDQNDLKELERKFHLYPELNNSWTLVQQTRLEPDLNIQFPGKSALYKKVPLTTRFRVTQYAAAACVLLACGFFIFRSDKTYTGMPMASVGKINIDIQVASTPIEKANNSYDQKIEVSGQSEVRSIARISKVKSIAKDYQFLLPSMENNLNKPEIAFTLPVFRTTDPAPQHEFPTIAELIQKALKKSAEEVVVEVNPKEKKKTDLSALMVKAYNKVTGKEVRLKRKYDNEGNTIGYGIVSANFEFYNGK